MSANFFIALSLFGPFALMAIALVNAYRQPKEKA